MDVGLSGDHTDTNTNPGASAGTDSGTNSDTNSSANASTGTNPNPNADSSARANTSPWLSHPDPSHRGRYG